MIVPNLDVWKKDKPVDWVWPSRNSGPWGHVRSTSCGWETIPSKISLTQPPTRYKSDDHKIWDKYLWWWASCGNVSKVSMEIDINQMIKSRRNHNKVCWYGIFYSVKQYRRIKIQRTNKIYYIRETKLHKHEKEYSMFLVFLKELLYYLVFDVLLTIAFDFLFWKIEEGLGVDWKNRNILFIYFLY